MVQTFLQFLEHYIINTYSMTSIYKLVTLPQVVHIAEMMRLICGGYILISLRL